MGQAVSHRSIVAFFGGSGRGGGVTDTAVSTTSLQVVGGVNGGAACPADRALLHAAWIALTKRHFLRQSRTHLLWRKSGRQGGFGGDAGGGTPS